MRVGSFEGGGGGVAGGFCSPPMLADDAQTLGLGDLVPGEHVQQRNGVAHQPGQPRADGRVDEQHRGLPVGVLALDGLGQGGVQALGESGLDPDAATAARARARRRTSSRDSGRA